ncbi:B12-binding domain-containing radical SAM protein [Planctomycetota bacterium]
MHKALDMVLIHPPASFGKDERPFSGVFPAGSGTDSFFCHAPLGINSLAQTLRSAGYDVRIMNLAKRLSTARQSGEAIDLAAELASLPARVFGISLHWAVHSPGALELAAMVRRLHGGAVIVMGGMTASFFHEDLLRLCPAVDGVLIGESEEAVVPLVEAARRPAFAPETVPNLAYRQGASVARNPVRLPHGPEVDYLDYSLFLPGHEPDTVVLPILRGCLEDCSFCGGSRSAYRDWFGRPQVAAMDPADIVNQLLRAADKGCAAALLAGDLRGLGRRRAERLLERLAAEELPVMLQNELFHMPDQHYLQLWERATRNGGVRLTLSPECSDQDVRARLSAGKDWGNDEVLTLAKTFEELGIHLLVCMFFALPGQRRDHILRDQEFLREVIEAAPQTATFMQEPMLFPDPGSAIFCRSRELGFRISTTSLATVRAHLERPYWTGAIGYETDWITKEELVDTIFDIFSRNQDLHHEYGDNDTSAYLYGQRALAAHREVFEELRAAGVPWVDSPGAAELVDRLVARHLPPIYRTDNNLKDDDGYALALASGKVPHSWFPTVSELLLGRGVAPARIARAFEQGGLTDEGFAGPPSDGPFTGLPPGLRQTLADLAGSAVPSLPGDFVLDLAAFEFALWPRGQVRQALKSDAGSRAVCADGLVALAPGAAILELRYPVFDLSHTELEDVLSREGRYVTAVANARSFTYEAEAEALLLGLREGPQRPVDLLPGDPGPQGMAALARFLAELTRIGVVVVPGSSGYPNSPASGT